MNEDSKILDFSGEIPDNIFDRAPSVALKEKLVNSTSKKAFETATIDSKKEKINFDLTPNDHK